MNSSPSSKLEWEASYSRLLDLQKRSSSGHLRKSAPLPDVKKLILWFREQKHRHESLEPDQIRKLLALGATFPGKQKHAEWYRCFFDLQDHLREHGVFPKPRTKLGRWIEFQRARHHKNLLAPHRVRWLESLGLTWRVDCFSERLQQLKAFKEEHGHCNVPWFYPANPSLGHYVCNTLRGKKSSLAPDEIQALESLGFIFAPSEKRWQSHFEQLEEHLKKFHAYPTKATNRELSAWVRTQRKAPPSGERLDKLNEIGFVWNPREERWMRRFHQLKSFKKEYGHCHISNDAPSQRQLLKWLYFQKNTTQLSPHHRNLLDSLGVE